MAETAPPAHQGVSETPSRPVELGTLTVKDKVIRHLATRAALETPGVQRYATGLDKLTGRDFPRVEVHLSRDHVRAAIDIAVIWPASLPAVTSAVRTNVARALSEWVDLIVDGVDVNVAAIVAETDDEVSSSNSSASGGGPSTRSVQ